MSHEQNEFDDEFSYIAAELTGLVGENEIQAREMLGNANYEKAIAFIERSNSLMLNKEENQIKYLQVISALHSSFILGILTLSTLSIAWSFYFWFK